jgi:hypothetical protein
MKTMNQQFNEALKHKDFLRGFAQYNELTTCSLEEYPSKLMETVKTTIEVSKDLSEEEFTKADELKVLNTLKKTTLLPRVIEEVESVLSVTFDEGASEVFFYDFFKEDEKTLEDIQKSMDKFLKYLDSLKDSFQ